MTAQAPVLRQHGNAYNIFILVLTIFSLAIMVLLLLPVSDAERDLLTLYDNAVCIIFLIDFGMNIAGAKPKRAYFIGQRGWLDLLGSIPSFGLLGLSQITALFRLARLSRLARITRLLRGQAGKDLVLDVLKNRGQYATFITILLAGIVLSVASILVLEVESRDAERQHQDRRRSHLVGPRDDHHGRLRRLLPGDDARASHRRLRHVRRHRDHRRPRQHPRQPARFALATGRAGPRSRAGDRAGRRRRGECLDR